MKKTYNIQDAHSICKIMNTFCKSILLLLYTALARVKATGLLMISRKISCYACYQKSMIDIDVFEFVKNIKQNSMNSLIDP
ncbi:hypothetical protein CER18_04510 [Bartonella tribocorum]|uniref:Uncharacterized protein n=1 Tax=Bartonella tribocorum TaxID=85701 RepID=A0A2M6USD0_9HYPH|nr:hypothetical protein CER18_04510 [Bartonella tribocorum]